MKQLSPEELIRHASSKQCTQCDRVYNKKNLKVRHHDYETGAYIGPYCNKCNLHLQHPRGRVSVKYRKQRKMQRKESLPTKLLEIISIRNVVRRGIMTERITMQSTVWMKMISIYLYIFIIFVDMVKYQIIIKHITKDFDTEDISHLVISHSHSYLLGEIHIFPNW